MSEPKEIYALKLKQMTLREKIGQMLLCGFHGTEAAGDVDAFLRKYPIGGVIYFARNVESPEQVERLSSGLQRIAVDSGNVPLWISIDQEGGMVARITEGIALMPGQMAIAAAGSTQDAYQAAYISGVELKSMGINMNFAPVLDVNNNAANPVIGVRSFGESPQSVAAYGVRSIAGVQDAGISATAKHFPGHGDTDTDSHLDLPVIPHDRGRVERVELIPFRAAIAAGVDAMMSAHIYFPALEPERLPVTLSRAVLSGLLRQELGYDGMIVTDCMEMDAIAANYGTVDAAVMAVEAGADLVLISHTAHLQAGAFEALLAAVQSGRISEARIDESVTRLLKYKAKRGLLEKGTGTGTGNDEVNVAVSTSLFAEVSTDPASSIRQERNQPLHHEVARRISENSITLVRDQLNMLPLKSERTLVITVATSVTTIADEQLTQAVTLGSALSHCGLDVVDITVTPEEVAIRSARLLQAAEEDDIRQIIVGTYNAGSASGDPQCRLIGWLQQLGKPLAVVALRSPYDLLAIPEVQVYVAAYESRPLAMVSAARALAGHIPFAGKLPVSIK
ncbi:MULTISPECIES: beta-N-acetylhexosaminidase [unclassified Paenibacillus]|uniref:beta-N-acetylhexosaminidase n=1 Tax=unclassified Paenibacillus TaxID=185978 RepID=UPI0008B559C4|nr:MULTISPECIES: beta-N-acetylhexosaminidase [unclassified Paenibacillus]SEL91266.1 beta-N-acetylhexosaminidase [Paenibacillus sp. OK003]SLK08716.1 beta-N-acetylhexosaminidase [Paenibacillus sp. RU5A]SOC71188.1 beta-N-acetylhexosaminidase [Paenibacillus sp. RU26A]SOC73690.1 beta-N-acetylhexosaminidase [Paenibacillus sp. RU5M]